MSRAPLNCVEAAPKKILLVSHSASRNGATFVLLNLLRWLKQNSPHHFEVVIQGRGDLTGEFQRLAPTRTWRNPALLTAGLPRRWSMALTPWVVAQSLRMPLRNRKFDLAYVNTVAPWPHAHLIARHARSLLWHIHELEYALKLNFVADAHQKVFPLASRFVAVSNSVRDVLAKKFAVPEKKIDVINAFIPLLNLTQEERTAKRHQVRRQLGWKDDAFVVGGCGALGWRKGTDLFLQIARLFQTDHKDQTARFLWVGGEASGKDRLEFDHDLEALNSTGQCCVVPSQAEVVDYYCAMDVFALTSREDPFPLVMLEAGAQHVPIVAFENSGGGHEFVSEGGGLAVPYLDVTVFAQQLRSLREQPELARKLGSKAHELVKNRYQLDIQAPKMLQSISTCLEAVHRQV